MARHADLLRHTDNDGDFLTAGGIESAVEIGRNLSGGYRLVASSDALRAVQTAGCFLAGLGETVSGGVVVEPGLRSRREDDWRTAYSKCGKGDLDSLAQVDPDLVTDDSADLANGLRSVFARLDDGDRALAVGHSPTLEAAVLGLTGMIIAPLGKGEGVLIVERAGEFALEDRLGA